MDAGRIPVGCDLAGRGVVGRRRGGRYPVLRRTKPGHVLRELAMPGRGGPVGVRRPSSRSGLNSLRPRGSAQRGEVKGEAVLQG